MYNGGLDHVQQTIGLSREEEREVMWAGGAKKFFPEDVSLKAGIETGSHTGKMDPNTSVQ